LVDFAEVHKYIVNVAGFPFMKQISIGNFITIKYFDSFEEFDIQVVEKKFTEKDYNEYFGTGDQIKKIMVGESARLLRQFPDVAGVTIAIQGEEVHVSRVGLNEALGFKIENLSVENGTWVSGFVKPYLYNEEQREMLYNRFLCHINN
jgi:hypothetical protein